MTDERAAVRLRMLDICGRYGITAGDLVGHLIEQGVGDDHARFCTDNFFRRNEAGERIAFAIMALVLKRGPLPERAAP